MCWGITSTKNIKFCKREVQGRYPYCPEHKLQPLYYLLTIVITLLLGLAANWLFSQSSKKTNDDIIEINKSTIFEDSLSFNILILSLDTTKDCSIEHHKYAKQIRERLNSQTLSIPNIKLGYKKQDIEITSSNQIKEIAIETNASVIIWGDYIEECNSQSKVRINYSVMSDLFIGEHDKNLKSNYIELTKVEDLQNNTFSLEIDNLINWILVLNYLDKDLTKASKLIKKVKFSEKCNHHVLYIKSLIAENLLEFEEGLQSINSILRCKEFIIPEFYKTKADIFLKQGIKYDSVKYYLSKAIELDSTYYDCYIDKFYAILELSKFGATIEVDENLQLSMEYPFSINGYFVTQKPKIERKNLIEAQKWFHFTRIKMMNEVKPEDLQRDYMTYVVRKNEIIRLMQMGGDVNQINANFQDAISLYNNGIAMCDENIHKFQFIKHQILVSKAVCLYHLKNEPALVTAVNEALKINPNSFSRVLIDPKMKFKLNE